MPVPFATARDEVAFNPKVVRAVEVLLRSERLLRIWRYRVFPVEDVMAVVLMVSVAPVMESEMFVPAEKRNGEMSCHEPFRYTKEPVAFAGSGEPFKPMTL